MFVKAAAGLLLLLFKPRLAGELQLTEFVFHYLPARMASSRIISVRQSEAEDCYARCGIVRWRRLCAIESPCLPVRSSSTVCLAPN